MDIAKCKTTLDVVHAFYSGYGEYVNSLRSIPNLDGCRSVVRRVLYTMFNYKNLTLLQTISGDVTGKYHPHDSEMVSDYIVGMVNCAEPKFEWQRGLLTGQGSFGFKALGESVTPGAARHIAVGLDDRVRNFLFNLIKFTPFRNSEMGFKEPLLLPISVPVALITGSKGTGVAASTFIPKFELSSLLKAYSTNKPKHLRFNYGLNVMEADLEGLWEKGEGTVTFKYDVYKQKSETDDAEVIVVKGDPTLFKPRINMMLGKYLANKSVWIRDESTYRIELVIGKTKFKRAIKFDEIFKKVKSACTQTFTFRIVVNVGEKTSQIGIKEWITLLRKFQDQSFGLMRAFELNMLDRQLHAFTQFDAIVDLIKKNEPLEDISNSFEISVEIVQMVKAAYEQQMDKDSIIENIKTQIQHYDELTLEKFSEAHLKELVNYFELK